MIEDIEGSPLDSHESHSKLPPFWEFLAAIPLDFVPCPPRTTGATSSSRELCERATSGGKGLPWKCWGMDEWILRILKTCICIVETTKNIMLMTPTNDEDNNDG